LVLFLVPVHLLAWTDDALLIWMDSARGHGLEPIPKRCENDFGLRLQSTLEKIKAMKIELLYVQGCLRWKSALALLRQVLREERVRESVQIIEVKDQEEAVRRGFLGSPTIRIDDYDIEPEAASRSDFGLGCRTYPAQETLYGVPSKEMICRAVRARIAK
jgi:hypothetical protein